MIPEKKTFLNRIHNNIFWLMPLISVIITVFIIGFSVSSGAKSEIKINNLNYKAQDIGKLPGTFNGYVYKITVDSVDYIVVTKGEAVTIIKHGK